jgi:WD40 repeat protein
LRVFDSSSLKVIAKQSEPSEISCISFSPNGQVVAVGNHESTIRLYRYSPETGLEPFQVLRGHSSYITHVDWSMDGVFLRSNSGDMELLHCKMKISRLIQGKAMEGTLFPKPQEVRNVQWNTGNCTLSWEAQGIWQSNMHGQDVNYKVVFDQG